MPENYLTFSKDGWKGQVLEGFQGEIDLGNLEVWAAQTRTSVVREFPLRCISVRERPGKPSWYYKILKGLGDQHEDFLSALKWRFRPSRFLEVLKVSRQLQDAGFHCPQIILAARKRTWWPCGHPMDFMIMESAPGRLVSAYLDGADGKPRLEGTARQEMLQRMGRELARLHQAGFVHGDCHPGNYFWEEGASGFCYIDNDRTRKYSTMNVSGALRNLVTAGFYLLHSPNLTGNKFLQLSKESGHASRITRDEWNTILDAYLESGKYPSDFREKVMKGIEKRLDDEGKSQAQ